MLQQQMIVLTRGLGKSTSIRRWSMIYWNHTLLLYSDWVKKLDNVKKHSYAAPSVETRIFPTV
eukprot:871083-Amphidinium_carterae.1